VHTRVTVKRSHIGDVARFSFETLDGLVERIALALSERTPLDMDDGLGTSSPFLFCRDSRNSSGESEKSSSDELHVEASDEGEWVGRAEKSDYERVRCVDERVKEPGKGTRDER
jgi:hypothetical protein